MKMNNVETLGHIADALEQLNRRMKRLEDKAFPDRHICQCCKGYGNIFNKVGDSVACNFCNGCGDRLFKGKS